MSFPRAAIRSLALLIAWLLYACGNAPTAPPTAPEPEPPAMAETDPSTRTEAEPDSGGVAPAVPTRSVLRDRLVSWALDLRETRTDPDARIARAILELTDDREERQP